MAKNYGIERKALQESYETQKSEREAELQRLKSEAELEKQALAEEREQGARRAYIREQKGLSDLPELLVAEGKSGGETELGKQRIRQQYEAELNALNEKYRGSAADIDSALREKNEKAAIQMRADEENYYAKLSRLASEEQAALLAQRLAEEQAAVKAAQKAAEKAAKAAQKEAEQNAKALAKAQKEAAKKSAEKASAPTTSGGQTHTITESTADTGVKLQKLRVDDLAILMVDGVRVANTAVFDGSGRMLISVGGKKMTPEEAEAGVKKNELRYMILSNGRGYYEPVVRTEADKQEKTKLQRVLSGWTANSTLMDAALAEAKQMQK